ncbi:hypothetical protein CAPTEDRAFT_209725 [Capitella teleta]|uniref:Golgin subfamily A conserved domain-containing protein n=1 Tax=Capitella teleta TaxID=283909 RepID=R7TRE5_CAPTE|nr:hypothetical protein CAPTEDRAFT_209725 [Capitella teleta]|eukprot:ELT96214.1 hypothetical protein CAPTEDRAFT_209725 [Capitella teleta]
MADAARREKLAAAKKKLKKFQKGKTPDSSPVPHEKKSKTLKEKNGPSTTPTKQEVPEHIPQNRVSQNNSTARLPSPNVSQNHVSPSTVPSPPSSSVNRLTGSTEQLQQLSRQVNGLINESISENGSSAHSPTAELEGRNQELAGVLDKHVQANQQLEAKLQEVKKQNSKLQQSLEAEKKGFEERLKRELGALKEQLQVHIQTIGILVAEKTELQSTVNQTQKLADQRIVKVEFSQLVS